MIANVGGGEKCGLANCKTCEGHGRIIVQPDLVGWQWLYDHVWLTEEKALFEFFRTLDNLLCVYCTACYPSLYPTKQTIH